MTSWRSPKALRMHLEQREKSYRRIRRMELLTREHEEARRRAVAAAASSEVTSSGEVL